MRRKHNPKDSFSASVRSLPPRRPDLMHPLMAVCADGPECPKELGSNVLISDVMNLRCRVHAAPFAQIAGPVEHGLPPGLPLGRVQVVLIPSGDARHGRGLRV